MRYVFKSKYSFKFTLEITIYKTLLINIAQLKSNYIYMSFYMSSGHQLILKLH